jgi:hypothetical protein
MKMQMPKGDLLKTLLSKGKRFAGIGEEAAAARRGAALGDDVAGAPFVSGRVPNTPKGAVGPDGMPISDMPGGASDLMPAMSGMRPLNAEERIKMLLARMSPQQKAALLAGSGGLAAGGLGGYMAGGDE